MKKNGELTERHIRVLRTIQELQPCGSTSVVKFLDENRKSIEHMIYWTLYRRGLVESDVVRVGGKSQRKPGTLRLTSEGEELLKRRLS